MHGQAPVNSQHSQQNDIHVAGGIATQNHIKRMAADRRAIGIGNGVCYKAQLKLSANYALSYITRYVQLPSVDRCSDIMQSQV